MFFQFLVMVLTVQENTAEIDIKYRNLSIENYTSCNQFVENTTFDPNQFIDIDWKIFYFWNPNFEESYNIKFSLASQVLVDRFQVELEGEIKPPVNWSNAVLFMESSIDFSALIVKTNVTGIFRIIPSLAFEYSGAPLLYFALKVVEPGYLGILNCKYRLCYALAPVDKMPHHEHIDEEAKKLGFWSDFGRSHIAMVPALPTLQPETYDMDDDNEDEHLEMLHNEDMQFL
ncbi:hypothetical protein B5X24_HaOG207511 [Helicoverpa armigera]|nr:hypothetical protein B5X24_HaOG207511 [Helicoverpa armigera]